MTEHQAPAERLSEGIVLEGLLRNIADGWLAGAEDQRSMASELLALRTQLAEARKAAKLIRETLVYGMQRSTRDWRQPPKQEAAHDMAEQLLSVFDVTFDFDGSALPQPFSTPSSGASNG